ncbi:MAG: tetratricopeptide repeat protein, partial [Myxococcota bacterium]
QGRQGRTDEAIATFMRADQLAPDSPAIWYGMGEAYMKVWRFDEAAAAFTVASGFTRDARIQRRLAIAHGSAKRPEHALAAAHVGLDIEPRDSHMLRSQMLALRSLEVPEEWKTISAKAFSTYKRDEQAPHIRDLCSRSSPECRRERVPIHVHELTPVTP